MPTLVLISRWLSPCAARRSTSLIWRIDNLFRGTGLLLAESGHFQQRRYGPSLLDGAAWAHSAETGGHLAPFWPGTFNRNARTLSTDLPGHSGPYYAALPHVSTPHGMREMRISSPDRKSTRLNFSHISLDRMPSSALK